MSYFLLLIIMQYARAAINNYKTPHLCTRLVHRATVLLRVSTVVAFCAALIDGEAVGAMAEITASVLAGVHWRDSPEGMPLWGPNRFWPGSGLVLRCLGPGFTVLALGPGFRPIFIHSFKTPHPQPCNQGQAICNHPDLQIEIHVDVGSRIADRGIFSGFKPWF